MITVADVMTRELVTVKESDDLALAESILRLGGIRHLLVVRDRRLVGLITQRDMLRAAGGKPASRAVQVGDVMTREVTAVPPRTSLAHAAHLMLRNKYGCLPVCEEGERLVGIITESDFVKFAADIAQDLDLVEETVRRGSDA